ncbi:MAG: pyruvate dehydrogenase complex dihydrolipoamide acetyltransferase [Afipia sp.]|jgi:pyruvate dehydrogenase E2 component (dihydrolipoamide acetyltransferase)|nr:pyruvate dehydrogenase complex dihydrolipoamide acetyltransferase [Afipia sp.]WIG50751.1 MAG: Dihydrolipoamide acetyltransferase component of pyruvate dehydrogenase complex [Afipia sp.]
MPINILMPALSPTMEKGNLSKWLKKEGDKVKSGDVIAEIETDKATMEVEAVDEGTIAKILVPEGTQDVPVNNVIAVLAGDGEDVKAAGAGAASAAPAKSEAAPAPAPKAAAPAAAPAPAAASAPAKPAAAPAAAAASVPSNGARVFSSPLARRLAKDAGIDLSRVTGSGPHGRVVARDIDQAKSGKGLKPAASAGAPAAGTGAVGAPAMSDQQILALYEEGGYESVPHDSMRRTIAQRLTAATNSMPTFYLTIDCDLGKLNAAREDINAAAGKNADGKPLYKISVNDFVIKAMALALQKIPEANVSWTETAMLRHKHSDIGVAVALPFGLITPIIRQAEIKTLSAISSEMKDLAARAKAKKLKPNEYQGGTSSVSNLGMYGIKDFTAVINPPQSSILAVGTGEDRAVVRNGQIVAASMMSVTLSCDHRAIDGALGAELITAFKKLIENPVMMVV